MKNILIVEDEPDIQELLRAYLRDAGSRTAVAGDGVEALSCVRYRDELLQQDEREAHLSGRPLELTAREFDLLHTLLAVPGRVFTREMLLSRLWGYDFYGDDRVVDSHIKNLRRKLGRDYIETVRGLGYRAAKEDR